MSILLSIHIAAGTLAVAALPVAMFSRKGQLVHRWAGRTYVGAMAVVLVMAAILSLRTANLFLGTVAVFTAYALATGLRLAIIRRQTGWTADRIAAAIMLAVALVMVIYGLQRSSSGLGDGVALCVFGLLGGFMAGYDLRRRSWPAGRDRIALHLQRMGAAAIATLTAVFVVNAHTIVHPAWVLWLLPTLIGTPVIALAVRRLYSSAAGNRVDRTLNGPGLD